MKNIHVIPTDKPSRVFNTNKGEYHFREHYVPDTIQTCKNHNIYITSDEEIKEDYVFAYGVVIKVMMFDTETLYFVNGTKAKREDCKKIILTTDQDLINDGVQPIDDEFLEWFVKNPSCESVEVLYDYFQVDQNNPVLRGSTSLVKQHKIIIPQEENIYDVYLKEELKKYKNIKTIVFNKPEEPKQETLPTKWFKTEQISTWIGKSITRITTEGESIDETKGGHGKLIVMHQCGENKEELISQLETMIYGFKEGFENFAN
jgi:hypothetical protein